MAATITVTCPNPVCGLPMRASTEHIGKKGKCPKCGSSVPIKPPTQESIGFLASDSPESSKNVVARGTQVNALLAALIGFGATLVLYGFFWLVHRQYLGRLMLDRGPIQFAITLVTCWGLAILGLKYLAVQRELKHTELELELIPLEIGLQITSANVDQFVSNLVSLPRNQQDSILAQRIRGALEHFKHRNNVSEVQTYLSTQAEIEASGVDSGYTLLRAFIWVCPILGFIGTVTGISDAVTGLASALPSVNAASPEPGAEGEGASGVGALMLQGMKTVTDGLAVAFDTTLVGLVCVVILMFPCETLRKTEYAMLDRVERFANESMLRRMSEGEGNAGGAAGATPANVAAAEAAMAEGLKKYQEAMIQWHAQAKMLGQTIGADLEKGMLAVVEKLTKLEATRLESVNHAVHAVDALFKDAERSANSWKSVDLGSFQQVMRPLSESADAIREAVRSQAAIGERLAAWDPAGLRLVIERLSQQLDAVDHRPAADGNSSLVGTLPAAAPLPGARAGVLGRLFGRG